MGIFEELKSGLGIGENRPTERAMDRAYDREPSLVDMLPWYEYLPEDQHFLYADGYTRMAGLEVTPIPTEGKNQKTLSEAMNNLSQVFSQTLPDQRMDPWVIQVHYSTEQDYTPFLDNLRAHVRPSARGTKYTEEYLGRFKRHMEEVHATGGYFHDSQVTDAPWVAKTVKVRIIVYRRYQRTKPREDAGIALDDVMSKLKSNLQSAGVKFKPITGEMFYVWMRGWLNPAPKQYDGDVAKMLQAEPWPDESEEAPFGRDLANSFFGSKPRSDREKGFWYLDGKPHCAVSTGQLRRFPLIGQFSGEVDRGGGGSIYATTDRLPEGTRIVMTVTGLSQEEVSNKITTIEERATGSTAGSRAAKKQAKDVLDKQLEGDYLFPVEFAFIISGDNDRDLQRKLNETTSLVGQQGVVVFAPDQDPIAVDTFIKNLPGVYSPERDRKPRARSRLYFSSHATAMSPMWGRSTGTGNPGITLWNRAAEPLTIDPLHKPDRAQNAHSLIVGPSGSGKSATVLSFLDQMMAMHRPRIFLIEAGNSFGLWAEHARRNGVTVNEVSLSMNTRVSIPPFSELHKIADEARELHVAGLADEEEIGAQVKDLESEDEVKRDRLGEAEQIVRVMITGGDPEEDKLIRRADKTLIRTAIIRCAENAADRPPDVSKNVKPSEIADMFIAMSLEKEYEPKRTELRRMGDSMSLFKEGLNGHLFERDGETWPETDITIVDMGQAVGENSADTLAVAYMSLLQQINAIAERDQHDERVTIVLTDEGHIILKNPLLAPYIIRIVKMWRKLGAWYWVATQNLSDFQGPAKALLNTMEFWWMLQMTRDEIDQASRFVDLTEAQRNAMAQCRKEPGKYTEGVLMSGMAGTMLFRNVPPPLSLALAQTEKDEKAERRALMEEHGLESEVDAAYMIADKMVEKRREAIKNAKR